ncbi:MAG TPA: glycosyltransferase family A protein [Candidatus Thermoplasmatota archaeon]|nr:glycosyltransferase family A protein [Candidatus Thermoplasmatota archaeon]
MAPRVSVVIPVYNPGRLLESSLGSARRQTYGDLEIIPVDDAGAEPVRPALEAASKADPRVRPVFHIANRGLSAALNSGLASASGELILVLEQDCEIQSPDALERAVALTDYDPALCLTGERRLPYGEVSAAEAAFHLLRDHLPDARDADLSPQAFSELKCDLFPRVALERCGGFDESFRFSGEDQMLGFRLRQAGFRLRKSRALAYTLRSPGMSRVSANLRREFTYGRTQAALLLRTSLGSLRSSARDAQGARRISNRGLSTLSGACLLLAPLLALLAAHPAFALLAAPAVARMVVVVRRGARLPRDFSKRRNAVALAVALGPVDDATYVVALGFGALEYLAKGKS